MRNIYQDIIESVKTGKKLLAVLLDPDKFQIETTQNIVEKINASKATHIFVGGSQVEDCKTDLLVSEIKKFTTLPIILFPGDINQISDNADAILFLSLISGTNPDYLIGKQIEAVAKLKKTSLEIISTGYVLIENGKETAVQKVTSTMPLSKHSVQKISDTAKAGEYLGMKLIYLEAGSGAHEPISASIINSIKNDIKVPLLVGGGIRTKEQIKYAYNAGADLVVIGTAFEEDQTFFDN